MIKSFKCKQTEKFFNGGYVSDFNNFKNVALRKLTILHAACDLNDLRIPPNNRLEKLKGNRKEQYSIRINQQWRICFVWENNNALNVEIIDYH